jgi:hypothetical protein
MKRAKPTVPTHVDLVRQADSERPVLTWRERQAIRRLTKSSSRARKQPPCEFDPLELRLGLHADLRQRRPYYAIWNPIYHELLRTKPALDDSLPGAAWLSTVYHGNRRDAVTLPGVRARLRAREEAFAAQYATPARAMPANPQSPQADLFSKETA